MAGLPDEIWRLILELGVKTQRLSYRDICCISMSSRRLRRLAYEHSLWSILLAVDFPSLKFAPAASSSSNSGAKFLYKTRFERAKEYKVAAHRRAVLRMESQIAVCSKELGDLLDMKVRENERMKATVLELQKLEKVRQASVSLNVWQPETVRGWHKQIVQQAAVPVEHRLDALEMDLKACKKNVAILNNSYNARMHELKDCEEALASLKYHPTRDYQPTSIFSGHYRSAMSSGHHRRKKLKQCNDLNDIGMRSSLQLRQHQIKKYRSIFIFRGYLNDSRLFVLCSLKGVPDRVSASVGRQHSLKPNLKKSIIENSLDV